MHQRRISRSAAHLFAAAVALVIVAGPASALDITLDEAMRTALQRSDRSQIINGDLEVAQQTYSAARSGFYLPEISINGSLPAYQNNESFTQYGNTTDSKVTVKRTNFDLRSNIQLKQNIITGGELTARANLWRNDNEYPAWTDLDRRISQTTSQGYYEFDFTQPILQPSEAKHDLSNKEDELDLARMTSVEERATLRRDVIEAYFGVLQANVQLEKARASFTSAALQAEIDSLKYADEILSEEDWLESSSNRLDAQLDVFDRENQRREQVRKLATLIDVDINIEVNPILPDIPGHFSEQQKDAYITAWENSIPIRQAEISYEKSVRNAAYTRSQYGISGNLKANYNLGRGNVDTDGSPEEEPIKTDSWEVSLEFSYPIWDGGASGASIKAAKLEADKARLELEEKQKSVRAEIVNLINRLDVSHRKLQLIDKQLEVQKNRLDIAVLRFNNGEISEIERLAAEVEYLDARDKHLEEMKAYYLDKTDLSAKYEA